MKQYETGLRGEALAEQYLLNHGMILLCRRFRGGDGEIDLIISENGVLYPVEIKLSTMPKADISFPIQTLV